MLKTTSLRKGTFLVLTESRHVALLINKLFKLFGIIKSEIIKIFRIQIVATTYNLETFPKEKKGDF